MLRIPSIYWNESSLDRKLSIYPLQESRVLSSIGAPIHWIGFIVFVLLMLALDLGVFHRQVHAVKVKEALTWSLVWIALAACFGGLVFYAFGSQRALEFATGYVIEKALSVDNLFVFVVLFSAFKVPQAAQHRVLFWGVLGALVMRALFIAAGSALLTRFNWLIYLFGAFLVFTAVKLWREKSDGHTDSPLDSKIYKLFMRLVPTTSELDGYRFFTKQNGRRLATPLFMVLILVEFTDLIFAVDSIPAVFAVTRDPFIVFTSNVFAILGLRSLYFVLADFVQRFHYLKPALAIVLGFVGVKMLIVGFVHIPIWLSLSVICGTLVGAVLLSLRRERLQHPATTS
ncbi:MAG TPA: TerC family protein [Polyangiaceae bacterium]|nr:TerC family protein [Polyangiaceae bacterium]